MKFTKQQWDEIAATLRPPETARDKQLIEEIWREYLENYPPRSHAVLRREWEQAERCAKRTLAILRNLHPLEPKLIEDMARFRQKAGREAETHRTLAMDYAEDGDAWPYRNELYHELTGFWKERGGHLRRARPICGGEIRGEVITFLVVTGGIILGGNAMKPEGIAGVISKIWY